MLRFALVCICAVAVNGAVTWSDCSADPSNTGMTVHSFDMHPNPVVFPGELHVDLNLTVNKQLDLIFLDVDLIKKTSGGGLVTIPCIGDTNIGTCKNIDACSIITTITNGSSVISQDLGLQIDKLLIVALGHRAQCPVMPENVVLHNAKLTLAEVPSNLLSQITNGDYIIRIKIKDDPTTTDNIGCFQFEAGIRTKAPTGLLFG